MIADVIFGLRVVQVGARAVPARTRRKKRIRKKWLRRYGVVYRDLLPRGEALRAGNVIYVNRSDWPSMRAALELEWRDG